MSGVTKDVLLMPVTLMLKKTKATITMATTMLFLVGLTMTMPAMATGTNWALLVAGSNGYMNYRHQADLCHAYKILTAKGGFPAENVITMFEDDIAYNSMNPYPGNLINRPYGPNVYTGVTKDYVHADVTTQNFLNVLSGNTTAMKNIGTSRVIESGPEDTVFVAFFDHGAVGFVSMPHGGYLWATDLVNTLTKLHQQKRFKQALLLFEACESGSMFDGFLPDHISVYAATAANDVESSWAIYYDNYRDTYLGDEFSIHWMEDVDNSNLETTTLSSLFTQTRQQTRRSHAQEFGDMSLGNLPLETFLGFNRSSSATRPLLPSFGHLVVEPPSRISSRDVKLSVLSHLLKSDDAAKAAEARLHLDQEKRHRRQSEHIFSEISRRLTGFGDLFGETRRLVNHSCLRTVVEAVRGPTCCGEFSDYSLKFVRTLANLCEEGYLADRIIRTSCEVCRLELMEVSAW